MSEKKHSKFSPSGSKRWMKCAASIQFCEKMPKSPTSGYANEGSAAHELGEYCLNNWVEPSIMLGATIDVEQDGKKYPVEVTDDMIEAVQVYVDFVRSLASLEDLQSKKKIRYIEQEFDLSWLIPDTYGSNDCGVYDPITKIMDVIDYKHGQGVMVYPEWNSQLLMYALGAMYQVWRSQTEVTRKNFSMTNMVKTFRLHIVQPRSFQNHEDKIKTWEIDSISVLAWGVEVLTRAARRTEDPNAQFETGDHCRFCNGLALCPEMVKQAVIVAKTEFGNPVLPDPSDLTSAEIAKVLNVVDVFSSWAKEVRTFATARLAQGLVLPGYKLVRQKADRRWVNTDAVVSQLACLGDRLFTKKLISPAGAEKVIKELKVNVTIDGLWDKPDGGVIIASESDKRKAVEPSTAISEFAEITEGE